MSICIHCAVCGHFYGAFRPRCEACGNKTPSNAIAKLEDAARLKRIEAGGNTRATKRERKAREVQASNAKTLCVFCRARGARRWCRGCDGLIHPTCATLHVDHCSQRDKLEALRASGQSLVRRS